MFGVCLQVRFNSYVNKNLVLSDELIKVEFPP